MSDFASSPSPSAPSIAPSSDLSSTLFALQQLIEVVAKLRSPDGGCPWDLAQTQESLIPYVIEEAYETVDAIRQGNPTAIVDELGDLLLQVVLQAQLASEQQQFDLADVANAITQKLIRRHPHVFGDVQVSDADEVRVHWERIKSEEEQPQRETETTTPPVLLTPRLERYARSLPPLVAAMKISKRAAAVGFEWDNLEGVWDKFQEELGEFHHALAEESHAEQESELGDLLFTLVNVARWCNLDPSEALHGTNRRFIQRFSLLESQLDRPLTDYTLAEFEQIWQQVKQQLKQTSSSSTDRVSIPGPEEPSSIDSMPGEMGKRV